jgi:hypothetical protein
MGLAEEGRHECDQQEEDQPRRVQDEPGGKGDDGNHVLRLAEQLRHQRRAPHCLATRPLQTVLLLTVLEVLEVERRGVLHQSDARRVRELLGQQRVQERHDAPEHIRRDREDQLDAEQPAEPGQQAAAQPLAQGARRAGQLREPHYLIDDQLADVQCDYGQERPQKAQHERGHCERRARAPDQSQEWR